MSSGLLCQACGNPLEPTNTGTICWTNCIAPPLTAMAAVLSPKPKKPRPGSTQKGTTMATKPPQPVDHDMTEHFYAKVELQIEPDLGKTTSYKGERLSLKQVKDQDVQLVNGEITVVEQVVTTVKPSWDLTDYIYEYPALKKEYQALADHVKKSGSVLKGHIVINDGSDSRRWFRLTVENDKVVAQAALLGWPDGTKSPYPEFQN